MTEQHHINTKNIASSKRSDPQGTIIFQNIPLSHGKITPHNYWNPNGKGDICASKHSTWNITVMGEHNKINSSETIGGRDAATTKRGIRRTDQVQRVDTRGPSIYGINRRIRGRMWRIVDGSYRGTESHSTETRMYPKGQIVTNNTEKPKWNTINLRTRFTDLLLGWIVLEGV